LQQRIGNEPSGAYAMSASKPLQKSSLGFKIPFKALSNRLFDTLKIFARRRWNKVQTAAVASPKKQITCGLALKL
jgi:hypothetical protein